MRKLTVLATLGLIALVSVGVLLLSLGTIGTAHARPVACPDGKTSGMTGDLFLAKGSGECHLTNVTVNGNINIAHSDTRLHLHNSIVNGNIRSNGGGLTIDIDTAPHGGTASGSSVTGNITVANCNGTIQVEDTALDGSVQLSNNGTVIFRDNTMADGGSVVLRNNGIYTLN